MNSSSPIPMLIMVKPSWLHTTTMSFANSFTALASPAPASSPVPSFGNSSTLAGSKHSYSPTQSLLSAPQVPSAVSKAPPASHPSCRTHSDYSVFNILNIFWSCYFINCKHLILNVLSAIKDLDGWFTWVDFLPTFCYHCDLQLKCCSYLFAVPVQRSVQLVPCLSLITA